MQAQGISKPCSFIWLAVSSSTRRECPSLSQDRLPAAGHDVKRLIETEIVQDGETYLLRDRAPGSAGTVLMTIGLALTGSRHARPDG